MAVFRCKDCGAEMTTQTDLKSHARVTGHGYSETYGAEWVCFEVHVYMGPRR